MSSFLDGLTPPEPSPLPELATPQPAVVPPAPAISPTPGPGVLPLSLASDSGIPPRMDDPGARNALVNALARALSRNPRRGFRPSQPRPQGGGVENDGAPPGVTLRDFADPHAVRYGIYDRVLAAAFKVRPVENSRYRLQLGDISWAEPAEFSYKQQKEAILGGRSLHRRLKGTYQLVDKATGKTVDSRDTTLAHVPYYTHRGTFILNGTEYTMGHQMRLRSGVYTRVKESGELEVHWNTLPGRGLSHRYHLEPESGIFKLNIGQANLPLMPLLKAMGVSDKELQAAWGKELYQKNQEQDNPNLLDKIYQRLAGNRGKTGLSHEDRRKYVVERFQQMELDPEVTQHTLGKPFTHITKDAMLAATTKLLKVSRGEERSDDRDDLTFQHFYGPEDLLAEPLERNAVPLQKMLWKATNHGNLRSLGPGLMTPAVQSAIFGSGLAAPAEEVNALDIFDAQTRVSRMGRGSIQDIDAIPDSARQVHPSQVGFIDLSRTSESLKIGVDLRLAHRARKGSDGKIYTPLLDPKTGREVYRSPQDIARSVLAFPGELDSNRPMVVALQHGRTVYVPRNKVDYALPHMENAFSPITNLVAMKSQVNPQRVSMGSRFLIQSLALREAEAPFVQPRVPGSDKSFYEHYGRHAGNVHAREEQGGRVVRVSPEEIVVRYDDGKEKTHELYNHLPYNRKSFIHNTPLVRQGDRIEPGQLLAHSNYTDKTGTIAMGKNLRVAYLAFPGPGGEANYEDAFVLSESAARKLESEHAYQHAQEWDETYKRGKKNFISIFPTTFDRKKLETLDEDGVIKPGTVVKEGDPLILAVKQKERTHKQLHGGHKSGWSDHTQLWEHHSDGIVTDVFKSDKGTNVVVKSYMPTQEADKLSGRHGDKGVVRIVKDDQMPHDENGQPFDIIANPLGVISRGNPGQVVEAILGKITAKTGIPYKIDDFDGANEDMIEWAMREAEKHGVSDLETVIDPMTGRKIPNVLTGYRYYLKLHHLSESKGSARGLGSYTAEGLPARGSEEGQQAKKVAMMDVSALLSHSALSVLRDNKLVRGNQNLEYWTTLMSGNRPATPPVPFMYEKFINTLRGSGINVQRKGNQLHLMALSNKHLEELAGDRELKNVETVDWKDGMKPIPGGLFDPGLTGSHGGNRWAKITLHEPLPNPVFEEPIRRLLNLTQKQFEAVLAGEEKLGEQTGPRAIAHALEKIDLDKAIEQARADIASGRKTYRDAAIRRLGYLKGAKNTNTHPRDWLLKAVPVLPPIFRPISIMQGSGGQLVADANLLYKDLFEANQVLRDMSGRVDDLRDERRNVYNAFKAVVGLGDPVNPKTAEKKAQGLLAQLLGSSPKHSWLQQKLIGTPVNLVGRAVATPDTNLSMDELGIPEKQAWTVYSPFIVRNLVRKGVGRTQALEYVEKKHPTARKAMIEEMEASPVIMTRAPVLHRYGHMAFWPKLVKGDTLRTSPPITKGYGLDYDGDTINWHVPVEEEARREAALKMLPSRNLFAVADFKSPVYAPTMEFLGGAYRLSTAKPSGGTPRVFATMADFKRAWQAGELGPEDTVHIVDSSAKK